MMAEREMARLKRRRKECEAEARGREGGGKRKRSVKRTVEEGSVN